jgi:glycosyltransferase involved in cell wall biosynthesis
MQAEGSSAAVVVPVYNRAREIVEALDAVAAQTLSPARLIVVDDGSTDDTPARVEEWIGHARVGFEARMVRQPNSGPAAARNRGVAEAGDCELLAFLDSDDLWPADHLARLIGALRGAPDAVAACADRLTRDCRSGRQSYRSEARLERDATTRILVNRPPTPSQTVVRARVFRELGGFDVRMRAGEEDYHLALRLSLRGRFIHVAGAPVIKRNHLSALTGGAISVVARADDHLYWRARMLDRFIHEEGGAAVVPARLWRKRVGHLWVRAGRDLEGLGRAGQAAECFQRAIQLRPWDLAARWWHWRLRHR